MFSLIVDFTEYSTLVFSGNLTCLLDGILYIKFNCSTATCAIKINWGEQKEMSVLYYSDW